MSDQHVVVILLSMVNVVGIAAYQSRHKNVASVVEGKMSNETDECRKAFEKAIIAERSTIDFMQSDGTGDYCRENIF